MHTSDRGQMFSSYYVSNAIDDLGNPGKQAGSHLVNVCRVAFGKVG